MAFIVAQSERVTGKNPARARASSGVVTVSLVGVRDASLLSGGLAVIVILIVLQQRKRPRSRNTIAEEFFATRSRLLPESTWQGVLSARYLANDPEWTSTRE